MKYSKKTCQPILIGGVILMCSVACLGSDSKAKPEQAFTRELENTPLSKEVIEAVSTNAGDTSNTAIGDKALGPDTTGKYNVAIGNTSLSSNTTGAHNVAIGYSSLSSNTTGGHNVASGNGSLSSNTKGNYNIAIGNDALSDNISGGENSAIGAMALQSNTRGSSNLAHGFQALKGNTRGNNNSAVGFAALYANTIGNNNTSNGYFSLYNNARGSMNSALGAYAGCKLQKGSNNIYIGSLGTEEESNVIRIGGSDNITNNCTGTSPLSTQTKTYISGISGIPVTGAQVVVSSNGQLGIVASSRRFKEEIDSISFTDEPLMKLHPVRFRYKSDDEMGDQPLQYGLIAEEVAEVIPEMVQFDNEGKPFAVNYQHLGPLMLAMIQKQQTALASIQRQNLELKNEVSALRTLYLTGNNTDAVSSAETN
jgi:hypothetical protein